ncbi:MAG: sodium:solute symporter family protein [Dehalococcoidales bacterium]|nr:MAG: sodium:solute symporter family protein [Dehalococcoidales bacterium]
MLETVIIAIYFIVMIAIGVYSRRRAKEADDFFVAGRKGSTLFITGSLLATIIGGSAIMVTSKLGFVQGLTGIWWLLVGSIGLIVLGIFLARKVRELGLYTLPELVETQYNARSGLVASILIVIAWIGVIGAQIIAAGTIMDALGIGNTQLWIAVFAVVFVVYTIIGGQHAIIRTDSIQSLIIFSGIIIGAVMVLVKAGGIGGLYEALPESQFRFPLSPQFDGYELVKLLLVVGLAYVVGPDMYSRLFCAKDAGTARRSVFWTALLIIPVALGIVLIGMGASALYPDIAAGQSFPAVIRDVLPPFLGGIVLAALLCAFMSSADTTLITAGTILSVDIVGKLKPGLGKQKLLVISRWSIVVMGVAALLLALYLQDIVNTILFAYTVYTGGVIIPVLAGFYKDRLKLTPTGAIAAIIGGGVAALISKLFDIKYLDVISLGISAGLLFLVSFLETKLRKS